MAVSFSVPSSPNKSVLTIDNFHGADFTNSPGNVETTKSPNTQNMIRDVPGKVRKSMGYHTVSEYDGQINGCHYMRGDTEYIVHSGTNIYRESESLYSSANNSISRSWQFKDRLYIIDGEKYLCYYSTTETVNDVETTTYHVAPVQDDCYVPTLTISKDPEGGGTQYEDLNLLTPEFTETFLGKANVVDYCMSFEGLDSTTVKVQIMNSSGDFVSKTEGTDFSVNRTTGVVTFTTAPGVSPVTGEDNVKITAFRTVDGYQDRINHCTIGTLFGVNGAQDRLFLSGNDDYINYDWYSAQYDPTYFEDTSYSIMGSDSSAIIGYTIISNYLACHKDSMERDQNIILRQGNLVDNEPVFQIVNTLQGAGAIAKNSFCYLSTEPIFLTELGVYAVTAQDITGEKYSQNRSYYLDGKLLSESNLEKAIGVVYKDMYWLFVNSVAYILDGLQPLMTDKSKPYATRQYAGFYRTNVPATSAWVYNGELYFGTSDGKINKFYTDKTSLSSYNDNGVAIDAIWETPDIDGKLFYKNKTFRYMAVRLDSAIATSIKIYAMKHGIWSFVKEDDSSGRYLIFSSVVFSKFSFSSDRTQKITSSKIRLKKVDKARFRLQNDKLNEPFGIFNIAFEYVEGGNFKG